MANTKNLRCLGRVRSSHSLTTRVDIFHYLLNSMIDGVKCEVGQSRPGLMQFEWKNFEHIVGPGTYGLRRLGKELGFLLLPMMASYSQRHQPNQ